MSTAASRPVALAAGALFTGPGTFRGLTVRETGGVNPAIVQIFDNTSGAGVLLATIRLAANESRDVDNSSGTRFDKGVFVVLGGTGVVEGSVRIG